MKQVSIQIVKHALRILLYGATGSLVMLLIVFVIYLNNKPEPGLWHKVYLDKEFTRKSDIKSFDEYRRLEDRLFRQLDEEVYQRVNNDVKQQINRYQRGSLADPQRWSVNWNRSFEFRTDSPRAGVLLVHGMSDSPYSFRNLGKSLNRSGAWVVGLRLPGHGTVPSGLVHTDWQDMAAAVELAVQHVKSRVGDQPVYIVGYSTGGALAMHYVLKTLDNRHLARVNGVVLVSPAIGVSSIAVMAKWQARLGSLFGMDKLEWNSILPEYDPFKYGSFAVNAGDQVYQLTLEIQGLLENHSKQELLSLPPVLAFQSVVDNTVSTPALVQGLFDVLPDKGNELILFDINRAAGIEFLLKEDPTREVRNIVQKYGNSFNISLITNRNRETRQVKILRRKAGEKQVTEADSAMAWPEGIYSLSHLALLVPENDMLYGGGNSGNPSGITLGNLALRGETGVLQISAASMLRLRWNPFYDYLEKRIQRFTEFKESKKRVLE